MDENNTILKGLRKLGENWENGLTEYRITGINTWHDGDWRSPEYMLNEKRYKILEDIFKKENIKKLV